MSTFTNYLRRRTRLVVGTGVAAAVLAGGGIAYAATSDGSSRPGTPTTTTLPTSGGHASGARAKAAARRHVVRGTVTAIRGNTWTVRTLKGATVTVEVTAQTKFGTPAAPASASSYRVGSTVGVIGTRTARTTVTATRIYTPKTITPGSTGASTPTTAAG